MKVCLNTFFVLVLSVGNCFSYAAQVDEFLFQETSFNKSKFIQIEKHKTGYETEMGIEHFNYTHERTVEDKKANALPHDNLLFNILGVFSSNLPTENSNEMENISKSALGLAPSDLNYLDAVLKEEIWNIKAKLLHAGTIQIALNIDTHDTYGRPLRNHKFPQIHFAAKASTFAQAMTAIILEVKRATSL